MGRRSWIKIHCLPWLTGSLRKESATVRGIFADLLALAGDNVSSHENEGVVAIMTGVGFTDDQLATIFNEPLNVWQNVRQILVQKDVISCGENGTIIINNFSEYQSEYKRVSVYRKRSYARKRGLNNSNRQGNRQGNKTLCGKNPSSSSSTSSSTSSSINQDSSDNGIGAIFAAWNTLNEHFSRVLQTSPDRVKTAKKRLADPYWKDNWAAGIERLKTSFWAMGKSDRKIGIEFFLRKESLVKILEGKYDSKETEEEKAKRLWAGV
jgi:hypothetical protein